MPAYGDAHLSRIKHELQEFMQDYAKHFYLLEDIVFIATAKQARRGGDDSPWLLDGGKDDGTVETVAFDKADFCSGKSGYQTKANSPQLEGKRSLRGLILGGPESTSGQSQHHNRGKLTAFQSK